jgi:putative addiction module killer protein
MPIIRETEDFAEWLTALTDIRAAARIAARIDRMSLGLIGDVKAVGDGVSEARIDHGPGYRLYFVPRGRELIILLCGGDKSSQRRDIAKAKKMATELPP